MIFGSLDLLILVGYICFKCSSLLDDQVIEKKVIICFVTRIPEDIHITITIIIKGLAFLNAII